MSPKVFPYLIGAIVLCSLAAIALELADRPIRIYRLAPAFNGLAVAFFFTAAQRPGRNWVRLALVVAFVLGVVAATLSFLEGGLAANLIAISAVGLVCISAWGFVTGSYERPPR
jgi:hypothetical protein